MKSESDFHNTIELPNLTIGELGKLSENEPHTELPDIDFKSRDLTSGSVGERGGFNVSLPEEPEDRFSLPKDTSAAVHTEIKSTAAMRSGEDDDFVIGKGFNITERQESISLRTDGQSDNRKKNISAERGGERASARAKGAHGKKKQKSGCLGAFMWIFVILFVSVTLAVGVIFSVADVFGIGKTGTSEVNIEMGSSTESIAESLKESGSIRFPLLFRLYSKIKHTDGTYQYGLYSIKNEGGYDGIIEQLQTEGPKADTVSVLIGDGWGIDKIGKTLEENGVCTKSDFISAVRDTDFGFEFEKDIPKEKVFRRLEGYLHPDTYDFYVTEDSKQGAEMAIRRMLEATDKYFTDENIKKAEKMGYSMHEILTMASIVQLEASGNSLEDKQKVSAVFYNRLDDDMTLGSSPTIGYAEQVADNVRYNTYETLGLPPGPLCTVNEDAINAALNPAPDFEYYYFVSDAKANFHFNKTLDEHNNTINQLQREGNWAGDKGMENMFK